MTTLTLPPTRPTESAARSKRTAAGIAIALLTLFALAGRLCYFAKPFDQDARLFIYFGKLFCDGGWYGHDVMDNKFPTVGMMTSAWWRAIGLWWPGYVIAQTVLIAGGAVLLGRMARRHFDSSAGLATTLFALVFLNFSVIVFGGFQLEGFQVFFAILAAGAALESLRSSRGDVRDAFVVGLAAGCAMMFKPNGGAVLGAFAIASMIKLARNPRALLKQGGACAIGLAVPVAVTLVYLVRTDTLRDMPELYRQIARYAASRPLSFADWLKPIAILLLVAFPIFVRARVHRHERIHPATGPDRAILLFVILWFAIELLGVLAHGHLTGNYFLVLFPPAALLYGMIPRQPRITPIIAGLFPIVMLSTLGAIRVVREPGEFYSRQPASDYLIKHTQPGDAVWQDCMAQTLMETNLRPGSRVPLTYLFLNSDDAPQAYAAIMLNDFSHRTPRYILLPQDLDAYLGEKAKRIATEQPALQHRFDRYCIAWRSIQTYVQSHYDPETSIAGETLYRRRDSGR